MPSICRLIIRYFLVVMWIVSPPVVANEPVAPAGASTTNEQEAVSAINQLSSPDGPELHNNAKGGSELTGVMVDRTITMAGKTFYRAFSQRAMDNLFISQATLTIKERPDARWGSQIWIMEGPRMYFRTQLSPRISEADRMAGEAVQVVEEALLKHQLSNALNTSADLGAEEF